MNKKYAISAIVLIALMSLSLIPLRASAYDLNPNNGPVYATVGPEASSLLMLCYTDPTAEFAAFQSGQLDFMDGPLTPTQYPLVAGDPKYAVVGPVGQFSLYDYDMNDAHLPFSVPEYRMGLSCLIDKDYFVNLYLPGAAGICYGPLTSYGGGFSDLNLYNLYHGGGVFAPSFISAYVFFCEALGAPTEDTFVGTVGQTTYPAGHWSTWGFASPIPTPPGDGAPAVMDGHISIYARTTGADAETRTAQGIYLRDQAVTNMPDFFSYAGNQTLLNTTLQSVFGGSWEDYAIPKDGSGNLLLPRINIDDYPEPRSNTATWVMSDYNFMLYTGGWSLSTEPSGTLIGWTINQDPAHNGFVAGCANYESYESATFDAYYAAYLSSASAVAGAVFSKLAEDTMMADQGIIPMWYDAGYQAALSCEQHAIINVGLGWFGIWTWLDAYPGSNAYSTSPGLDSNTFYWGWSSDFENVNIVSSQWVWDYYILNEIYEPLVAIGAYSTTDLVPQLATSYSYDVSHTEWAHTVATATIRSGVYWQNVPFMHREAFTPEGGTELNGPMVDVQFTPLDVAFTFQYLRDQDCYQTTWNGFNVDDVDHVAVNPVYNVSGSMAHQMALAAQGLAWPYWNATAFPNGPQWQNITWVNDPNGANFTGYTNPGGWSVPAPFAYQYDFVHFDPSVGTDQIKVYLHDDLTWLLYYKCFGTYILPMHIFEFLPVGQWTGGSFTTRTVLNDRLESPSIVAGGADLAYGSGPYILTSGVRGESYKMVANIPGTTWVGGGGQTVTQNHGYYWSPIGKPDVTATASNVGITGYGLVFETTLVNSNVNPVSIDYHWSYQAYKLNTTAGTYSIAAGSGDTATVAAYSTPAGTSTVQSLIADAVLPTSLSYNDSLRILLSFVYKEAGVTHEAAFGATTLNCHPADFAGAPVAFPYLGADGIVDSSDLNVLGVQWGGDSTGANPLSALGRADINKDGVIDSSDLNKMGVQWGLNWP